MVLGLLDTSSPTEMRARTILLALAASLLVATPAPAPAAEDLRVAQSWQPFQAATARRKAPSSEPNQQASAGGDHRNRRPHLGNRRRPPRPAILTVPAASGQDREARGVAGGALVRVRQQAQAVPRQVLVVLDQNQSGDLAGELARRHGLQRKQSQLMPLLDGRCELYELRGNRSLAQVMATLSSDPRFRLVQANFRYRAQGAMDTATARLPQYALDKMALPQAHELALGRDVVIAVIDSAIDQSHPDLQGAVALTFDAVGAPDRAVGFHGTAVAGIIRAQGAMAGAAPQASVLAIRAFRVRNPGEVAETTSWTLLRAIDWAVQNKANVLNLSFVGPKDDALHLALQAATARRVIAVAAAGNNGPAAAPAFPAAYPEVIAVTAVDAKDRRYAEANRGAYIAVAAPGVDILAPVAKGKHSFLSGTSFATAYVSGVVALLLERNRDLDTGAVLALITAGAEDLGPAGRDDDFGAGRVNAFASLKAMERVSSDMHR
jgi:subtilisin family serine protease